MCIATDIKVQTSKNYKKRTSPGTNYAILTKRVKVLDKKKPISNLKSMQSVGLEQPFTKFIGMCFSKRIISL